MFFFSSNCGHSIDYTKPIPNVFSKSFLSNIFEYKLQLFFFFFDRECIRPISRKSTFPREQQVPQGGEMGIDTTKDRRDIEVRGPGKPSQLNIFMKTRTMRDVEERDLYIENLQ
jgi:hypothetical protein